MDMGPFCYGASITVPFEAVIRIYTAYIHENVTPWQNVATEWHHVAAVYKKGDFLKFYLNGEEVDSVSLNGVEGGDNSLYDNNVAACYIGTDNGFNYEFDGSIDEVRAYGRALSGAEIAALAQR